MNLTLPEAAREYAGAAHRALAPYGVDLARRAVAEPAARTEVAEPILEKLGIDDLDPRADVEQALAAGELCRVAGSFAFPYPVAARLAARPEAPARFLAAVDAQQAWVDHADLPGGWLAVGTEDRTWLAEAAESTGDRLLAPFAVPVRLSPASHEYDERDRALVLALGACTILGTVRAADDLAVGHVASREQFGKPLSRMQAVQMRLADAAVAVRGLRQLARFTLWHAFDAPTDALTDALALRVAALEAAEAVLSTSHLLHGAIGFCTEHDLALLTRCGQAGLRLPTGLERSTEQLAAAIDTRGFASLFDARTSEEAK
jgi:hypothetical protein